MKRILAIAVILALLSGCGAGTKESEQGQLPPPSPEAVETGDLMAGVRPQQEGDIEITPEGAEAVADFGWELFRRCMEEGDDPLVSPVSVLSALAMTANGAAGQTLVQMEKVFGIDMELLNAWLHAYASALPDEEGGSAHLANGVWFNADAQMQVGEDFLQTNANYYGAGVYEKSFEPALTEEINGWVREHTDGRIERIIDELSRDAVMVLVNALSFDGVWEEIYRADQVQEGTFTTEDGQERDVPFMYSTEQAYLRADNASGFIKYYQDRGYAFAALLPDEGVSLADCAASLTGEKLRDILDSVDGSVYVNAAIPKFTAEYGAELSGILAGMGMRDAFDEQRADFSRITAETDLVIDRVLHKTFISVDEKGTQAGAATAVEVREAGLLGPEEIVHLDRPFVYMLIDCEANVPLFIGAVTDLG